MIYLFKAIFFILALYFTYKLIVAKDTLTAFQKLWDAFMCFLLSTIQPIL